ncbi:hypothetical protein SNK03_001246 [Fusarium graminearum]
MSSEPAPQWPLVQIPRKPQKDRPEELNQMGRAVNASKKDWLLVSRLGDVESQRRAISLLLMEKRVRHNPILRTSSMGYIGCPPGITIPSESKPLSELNESESDAFWQTELGRQRRNARRQVLIRIEILKQRLEKLEKKIQDDEKVDEATVLHNRLLNEVAIRGDSSDLRIVNSLSTRRKQKKFLETLRRERRFRHIKLPENSVATWPTEPDDVNDVKAMRDYSIEICRARYEATKEQKKRDKAAFTELTKALPKRLHSHPLQACDRTDQID